MVTPMCRSLNAADTVLSDRGLVAVVAGAGLLVLFFNGVSSQRTFQHQSKRRGTLPIFFRPGRRHHTRCLDGALKTVNVRFRIRPCT
ncbi:MAG: hypothetical protein JWO93_3173 [Micrococcaceae bacterium]|jgi:hypothetical protein|nr:hypothetical protein [Micrococcaceae bacterium]